ncbi:MAG: hypothetical protein QOH54_1723 [Mycobacterium sp.]|jgi:hypothetical protein|nr:hypothetical protein [Mycobacterium sp.]
MTTTDVPPHAVAPRYRRDEGSSTSMTTGSSRFRSASSRWSTPTMTTTTTDVHPVCPHAVRRLTFMPGPHSGGGAASSALLDLALRLVPRISR